jgi:WD40-like Beta Propeller Repeat
VKGTGENLRMFNVGPQSERGGMIACTGTRPFHSPGLTEADRGGRVRGDSPAPKGGGPVKPRTVLVSVAVLLTTVVPSCTTSRTSSSSPTITAQHQSTIAPSSLSGKILFTRAGGKYGDETVFTANADGIEQRRITGFGQTCCPRWSPDGMHILVAALAPDGKRITTGIIRSDGSVERDVPLPAGTLNLGPGAWSPDAKFIAFEGWNDADRGENGIYYGRASDGGDLRRLTHAEGGQHDRPMDISPDGSEVFFFRPVEGFPSYGDDLEGSLFVVSTDGHGLRRVTPPNLPVEVVGNAGGRLSRDGTWIVFTSAGAIWKIRPDGSGLKKVFQDDDGSLAITPTWSPDGRFILFGLDPPGSLGTVDTAPPNGLYVIGADGAGLTPVIKSDDWKREPEWVAPG